MNRSDVLERLLELRREVLVPLASGNHMALAPAADIQSPPMVLLLGNHSSGKSSFINHLLGTDVQRTGVAPTDDGFTVLMHGNDINRNDGRALTTTPGLPFGELTRFGPGLVEHLAAAYLPADLLHHIRLVDSPGMIDAGDSEHRRPYDFGGVVHWFADHADLVLLFFDPEKPGTTGETLRTLTESLSGIDHKLRIVMNKMDLFDGIRDFARTYGALCWNLSRSLDTKDMPHIYTTVIPEMVRDQPSLPLDGFAAALLELESFIGDLPRQRLNAVISRTLDESRQLDLLIGTVDHIRAGANRLWRRVFGIGTLISLAALIATLALMNWSPSDWRDFLVPAGGVIITIGLLVAAKTSADWSRRVRIRHSVTDIDGHFRTAFRDELAEHPHPEDLLHQWSRSRGDLVRVLEQLGLDRMAKVSKRRRSRLRGLIEVDLPNLRL